MRTPAYSNNIASDRRDLRNRAKNVPAGERVVNLRGLRIKRPIEAIAYTAAAIGLLASLPNMIKNSQAMGALSEQIRSDSTEEQRLKAKAQTLSSKAKLAGDRYKSGCLFVQTKGKNTLISITQGQVINDAVSGNQLATNTVVCDHTGVTGVIGDSGAVEDVAFTGDRELVQAQLRKAGINMVPSDPNYGSSTRNPGGKK